MPTMFRRHQLPRSCMSYPAHRTTDRQTDRQTVRQTTTNHISPPAVAEKLVCTWICLRAVSTACYHY